MADQSIFNRINKITDPEIKNRLLRFHQLPQQLQTLMTADTTTEKMKLICISNQLNSDQSYYLSYYVGMIILGELHISQFVKTVAEKCKLDKEKAINLCRQINSTIFLSYAADLKQVHNLVRWPGEQSTDTTQTITPEPSSKPPQSTSNLSESNNDQFVASNTLPKPSVLSNNLPETLPTQNESGSLPVPKIKIPKSLLENLSSDQTSSSFNQPSKDQSAQATDSTELAVPQKNSFSSHPNYPSNIIDLKNKY